MLRGSASDNDVLESESGGGSIATYVCVGVWESSKFTVSTLFVSCMEHLKGSYLSGIPDGSELETQFQTDLARPG
jgi:hypothetical protein